MLRQLSKYMTPYRWYAILSPILMVIEVFADVYIPFLMKDIVNIGIMEANTDVVISLGVRMILSALIGLTAGVFSARMGAVAGYGFGANVRSALYRKIQGFSFSNLDQFSVPSLITRLTNDCNNMSQAAMMSLRMGIRAPALFVFALIMANNIDPRMARVFLVAIPILFLVFIVIMKLAGPRFRALQKRIDNLNAIVQEDLTNIREIKTFVRVDHEKRRFKKSNDSLMQTAFKAITVVIVAMPAAELVIYSTIIAILWLGGQEIVGGNMLAGDLISFLTYVMQILMSLVMLAMVFLQLTRAKASADRVTEVLNTDIDIHSPEQGLTKVADGSVSYENVSFGYPGSEKNSLVDINLDIKAGEVIGVLGATGSGKSTLLSLIPRLYDVTEGRVLVGGQDVRAYDLETLRDAVSFVLQQNTLFSGTIRENMQWGDENASDEKIITALKRAQAWEFVGKLPDGLDSHVEQGGTNFSGGQRQRLTIARALLKDPKILILDDSTSAVDMDTDARIRQAFRTELQGVTKIIVAQRIASVEDADRIIILDEGRVSAFASADELMETSTIYREIFESQQRGVVA
ncbi:MAG: ABC transporter ATP-binding protein [Eubacteriales bacterium]|nr:ABC transporter ATP-binding protein [Eubacteriales bacterium]MDD4324216.1 ABC transporter ATP-binding protein [Eubacteriales bacterium]